MKHRGALTVFVTAFAVVLIGGLALAQVGVLNPADATPVDAVTATRSRPTAGSETPATASEAAPNEQLWRAAAVEGRGVSSAATSDGTVATVDEEAPGDEGKDSTTEGEEPEGSEGKTAGGDEGGDDDPDTTPPRIEILYPEEGQVFHEKTIAFEGKTEPGAAVTAGRYEADVDREGHWRIRLVLTEGRNLARFTATDAAGNSAEATVTVVYEPKKEDPPAVEFSAHQKYGSSSATPPFDVFWGTATPGAKIWIGSDFGGKQLAANENGGWEARVEFPEAPIGKAFKVVIESNDGGRKVFEFVRKGDGVEHEFTANQQYGSCSETVPYDVFWGRADAGERIWVESPYGHGVAEANADGKWEIKVEFPEAPIGKKFEIVIEAEHGGRHVFTFVHTEAGKK